MKDITVSGLLQFGIQRDGVWHKDFTMRVPTLEDVECAIEDAGEGASPARVSRHKWALTLTRLGTMQDKDITPEILAELPATEYGILRAAEDDLVKKLHAASAAPCETSV